MSTPPETKSRTPKLDEHLRERYEQDPRAFTVSTILNLLVGIFLLVVCGALGYFAFKVVGLSSGGDALLLMVLTIFLCAVAILHDVNWRFALQRLEAGTVVKRPASGGKSG